MALFFWRLLVVASFASVVGAADAQPLDPAVAQDAIKRKGFHSDRSYFSPLPFEHFDPVTGNLVLTFVDLELPGPAGRSLRFSRTYNSQPTGPDQTSHWTFGIQGLIMRVKDKPLATVPFQAWDLANLGTLMSTTPQFYASDGGIHSTVYLSTPVVGNPGSLHTVTNGNFVRYNRATATMQYPDGLTAHFRSSFDPNDGSVVGDGRIDWLRDQYGNEVTFSYEGEVVIVRQFVGTDPPRVVTFEMNSYGLPDNMIYEPAPGSSSRTWHYDYTTQGQITNLISAAPVTLSGEGWSYEYNGLLSRVHTPQDGTVEYQYETRTVHINGDPNMPETFTILVGRTSSDAPGGVWDIYADFDPTIAISLLTRITTPTGTVVTYEHQQVGTPPARVMGGGYRLFRYTVTDVNGGPPLHKEDIGWLLVPTVYHSSTNWWGTTEMNARV